jgi:hypothetical protein
MSILLWPNTSRSILQYLQDGYARVSSWANPDVVKKIIIRIKIVAIRNPLMFSSSPVHGMRRFSFSMMRFVTGYLLTPGVFSDLFPG